MFQVSGMTALCADTYQRYGCAVPSVQWTGERQIRVLLLFLISLHLIPLVSGLLGDPVCTLSAVLLFDNDPRKWFGRAWELFSFMYMHGLLHDTSLADEHITFTLFPCKL